LSTLNLRHTSEAIATVEVLSLSSDFDCSEKKKKKKLMLKPQNNLYFTNLRDDATWYIEF